MSRLQEQYKTQITQDLFKKLNCNNIHEVPKIEKIVLNIGLGEAKDDAKIVDKLSRLRYKQNTLYNGSSN